MVQVKSLSNCGIAALSPAYTLHTVTVLMMKSYIILRTENIHSLLIIVLAMCYVHSYIFCSGSYVFTEIIEHIDTTACYI